jgi:hypothetical protein
MREMERYSPRKRYKGAQSLVLLTHLESHLFHPTIAVCRILSILRPYLALEVVGVSRMPELWVYSP